MCFVCWFSSKEVHKRLDWLEASAKGEWLWFDRVKPVLGSVSVSLVCLGYGFCVKKLGVEKKIWEKWFRVGLLLILAFSYG